MHQQIMAAYGGSSSSSGYFAALASLSGGTPKFIWKMDEASGNLADATGNGHTATPSGDPLYDQASIIPNGEGKSIYFSGNDSFARATGLIAPFTAGWLAVWIKKDFTSGYRMIYGEDPSGGGRFGVWLNNPSGSTWVLKSNGYNSGWKSDITTPDIASPNGAIFVVVTGDGTGRQIYINGSLAVSDATNWVCGSTSRSTAGKMEGDPNLWTGWLQGMAGGTRKLSVTEVATLWAASQP